MFKKGVKKTKPVLLGNSEAEEKVEIKSKVLKKKVSKWIDVPVGSSGHSCQDLEELLKAPEGKESLDKELVKEVENPPQMYGEGFNQDFNQLVEVMNHRIEIQSNDKISDSSEEFQSNEICGESDSLEFPNTHNKTQQKKTIKLSDFIKFVEEKIQDVNTTRLAFTNKLEDIKRLKIENYREFERIQNQE